MMLLENTAQKQRKGGKLCPAWLGPYTISRNLGKGVYELKNAAGSIVRKKANISRLKVYTCRDGQDPMKSGKERNDNRMDSQEDKEEEKEGDEKEEEEKINDTHEGSKGKAMKRKNVVHSERAAKKRHMATMSEESLKQISMEKPLNDEHVTFAQNLLQQQFPILNGLQTPLLSQNNGFCPVTDESIQIHHTGQLHWVTSCSIGGDIQLYDSRFKGGDLSSSLQVQLAQIYTTCITKEKGEEEDVYKFLQIEVPAVQMQQGETDCGLFVIAFAYHAARGDDLSKIKFHQEKMRQHLVQCFKKKRLEPFPHTRLEKPYTQSFFPYIEIELYCECNMPEVYDDMIQCDECEEWFHLSCVGLQTPPAESEWYCSKCF